MQVEIGAGTIDNFTLKQEITGICSNASRVLEGMIEFASALKYFSTAVKTSPKTILFACGAIQEAFTWKLKILSSLPDTRHEVVPSDQG